MINLFDFVTTVADLIDIVTMIVSSIGLFEVINTVVVLKKRQETG